MFGGFTLPLGAVRANTGEIKAGLSGDSPALLRKGNLPCPLLAFGFSGAGVGAISVLFCELSHLHGNPEAGEDGGNKVSGGPGVKHPVEAEEGGRGSSRAGIKISTWQDNVSMAAGYRASHGLEVTGADYLGADYRQQQEVDAQCPDPRAMSPRPWH